MNVEEVFFAKQRNIFHEEMMTLFFQCIYLEKPNKIYIQVMLICIENHDYYQLKRKC